MACMLQSIRAGRSCSFATAAAVNLVAIHFRDTRVSQSASSPSLLPSLLFPLPSASLLHPPLHSHCSPVEHLCCNWCIPSLTKLPHTLPSFLSFSPLLPFPPPHFLFFFLPCRKGNQLSVDCGDDRHSDYRHKPRERRSKEVHFRLLLLVSRTWQ